MTGDFAKFFRNESIRQPGVFAADPPSEASTLLARESIQNSWDAARELADYLASEHDLEDISPFTLTFRFRRVSGEEKRQIVDLLNLSSLSERTEAIDDAGLGFDAANAVADVLSSDEPLNLLYIEEQGAIGMYGPWVADKSKMYLALVAVGFTQKSLGAGGSFGFGKAGLVRASRIRTVIAHSKFFKQSDDPDVESRLFGAAYWVPHKHDDRVLTGLGRFGEAVDGVARPFENAKADLIASALGMRDRTGPELDDLGSSFLLADPSVEPLDLMRAIERNWWPAIVSRQFRVEVIDYNGRRLVPRPRRDPDLKPFVRAYEMALDQQDNQPAEERRTVLKPYRPRGGERYELGSLGLKADSKGWSYADSGDEEMTDSVNHSSLVALVRGPRMVVEYLPCITSPPFVRGVFVASPDVDEFLRQTEPKAHDQWLTRGDAASDDPVAHRVAEQVLRSIRAEVREFRKSLKRPPARRQDIVLPWLEGMIGSVFGATVRRPPTQQRAGLLSVSVSQRIAPSDDTDQIFALATITATPTGIRADMNQTVSIRLRYAFDEGGNLGDDCPIKVRVPRGFTVDGMANGAGAIVRGELRELPVEVTVESAPYSADWSGRLIVDAELAGDETRLAERV